MTFADPDFPVGSPAPSSLFPPPRRIEPHPGVVGHPGPVVYYVGIEPAGFPVLPRSPQRAPVEFRPVASGGKPWLTIRLQGANASSALPSGYSPTRSQQSYSLDLAPLSNARHSPAVLTAAHPAGLRHGLITLTQILQHAALRAGSNSVCAIPCMHIADEPGFVTRGFMLDVSRCRVPTLASLLELLDVLAGLKFNHFQLYLEHAFAYAGHEEVWADASPLTPTDIRRLDERARELGIDLVANQNCFGHLTRWLSLPRYAPLAETHGDWVFQTDWGAHIARRGPFSLCPTDPASLALIRDLLGQLLPCFSSPLVNIGCDETYDVGQGRSAEAVTRLGGASVGRTALAIEYIRSVAEIVREHGRRPMFWADILLHHPQAVNQLPNDLIPLVWGYEPDAPFAESCAILRSLGRDAWACPGTGVWRSITGRTYERRGNLQAAARADWRREETGFLITEWGDCGHRQQWPLMLHALADGAQAAWNPLAAGGFEATAAATWLFGPDAAAVGLWLAELGNLDLELRARAGRPSADGETRAPLRNATLLFNEMEAALATPTTLGPAADWETVRGRLSDLAARLPVCLPVQVRSELAHVLDVAAASLDWIAIRDARHEAPSGSLLSLARRLEAMTQEHRRLWLARCRPGGLDESCATYARMIGELDAEAGIKRARRGWTSGHG